MNSIAQGQTGKNGVNNSNKNVLYNEYWSISTGGPASVNFEHYFFNKNGTFVYTYGFSGGMYSETKCKGTYKYDPLKNEIKLVRDKGFLKETRTPNKIFIKDINDSTVTISIKKSGSDYITTMDRTVGMTTDQYWYKGPNSSHSSIHFTLFGQATIVQETDIKRSYVCSYHIVEDCLFLEIRSMTSRAKNNEQQTKLFTPEIKTFIKINIDKETVGLENIELYKIIDGKRNWTFKDMAFQIENKVLTENISDWIKYTRVTGSE